MLFLAAFARAEAQNLHVLPASQALQKTSRPFLNRTASRYWYASALNCTNVTSSVACTSNCRCRSFGMSHKSKRAPGGTQTAGVCLDQNLHTDAVGGVRPRAPVGKRKTINCSRSAASRLGIPANE